MPRKNGQMLAPLLVFEGENSFAGAFEGSRSD
jgi:hypothetical protein